MRQNLVWGVLLAALAIGGIQSLATFGQEATPAKPAAKALTGRLPSHYKGVVTEDQKQKIYGIQDKYKDRLAALTEQVKKVQAERNAEIEALLSAEQKQKIAASKAAAEKKKADATAAPKTTAAPAEVKPVEVTKPAAAPASPSATVKPGLSPATK